MVIGNLINFSLRQHLGFVIPNDLQYHTPEDHFRQVPLRQGDTSISIISNDNTSY